MNNDELFREVKSLIMNLRRGKNIEMSWNLFLKLIGENIEQICDSLDTRWLISICDTFVDFADPITSRNAMLVVQIANFEKLWATNLLMYDVKLNKEKLRVLKRNRVIHLWDGMYSLNINHGDMTNNFFRRVNELMKESPIIERIYFSILERIKKNDTVLANLNIYHQRLFSPFPKKSIVLIIARKIRRFYRRYKL